MTDLELLPPLPRRRRQRHHRRPAVHLRRRSGPRTESVHSGRRRGRGAARRPWRPGCCTGATRAPC